MPGGSGQPMIDTNIPTKYVIGVRFGILSEQEVIRMSVAEINNEIGLDIRTRQPQHNGVHDPRMGTMDRDTLCETCGCNYNDCPGHFAHINLAQPVYHPGYVTHVNKILRCICCECGRLRIRSKQLREQIRRKPSARTRFRLVFEACQKIKECIIENPTPEYPQGIGCGHIQPLYSKEGLQIWRNYQGVRGPTGPQTQSDPKTVIKPEEVMRIFRRIQDEDLKLMGMDPKSSRPEWMIIKALAVCPPPVRPSVEAGDGARSNDDLTYAYTQILRTNNELFKIMKGGHPDKYQMDLVKNLQTFVATLMDNNQPDQPKQKHVGGRPIKCIRSRLKGKEGRVRGNLMGKRVDFSARTVITPDPILQLDQLGVPEMIAMNLTVPETVTKSNMELMKQLVCNGPYKWPGAKYIIRHDGKQIDLSIKKKRADAHLDYGYVVERQLRDGDWVIFNRQPSLHKMSLMGHRVKVLPFQTFRLNLSVTSPYNADFDGDEMNMHVPQSYETMAEIKEIMAVPKQIVAPKDNKPVMGIVQDSLLGIMLFTQRDTFIEMDYVMNLLMWIDYNGALPPPAIIKPRPLWTGKQILSLVLPEVNYRRNDSKHKGMDCPKDLNVLIKNGELLCGILTKNHVGAVGGGLVHITWRDLGPEACKMFFSNTQNVVNNWLVGNGFSVGVQDIVASKKTVDTIEKVLIKFRKKVQRITQKTQRGQLKTLPGKGMYESFEVEVNTILRDALEKAGGLATSNLESWNRLNNMVTAGSKGSKLNISQIMACCGQQNVEGKRIPFGFDRRTLPHFSKDDFGPESKGFVSNCYFFGLNPQEFYFHAMGGREGLIDTACKTAETGYIQRRLIKALEDVQVKYDQTVRTSKDQVIQFIYGEDGMAAEYIENMSIPLIKMDNKKIEKQFKFFKDGQEKKEKRKLLEEIIYEDNLNEIEDYDQLQYEMDEEFKQILQDREDLRKNIFLNGDDSIWLPVNASRLLWNSKERFNVNSKIKTDLTPSYVIQKTKELLDPFNDNSIKVYQDKKLRDSILFEEGNGNATWLSKIYLRQILNSKNIVQNQRMTKNSFDWLLGEISTRFRNSLVNPGEMVGSIGAQSMGEPATQMTLNTFHMAGVASKNVTLGVPRLKEIINVAKSIKTPSLKIILQKEYQKVEMEAHEVGNKIELTTLGHVVANSSIYYDPDPLKTIIKADQELLDLFNETELIDDDYQSDKSPWLIRFVIDNKKIQGKNLTIRQIDEVIHTALKDEQIEIIRQNDLEDLPKLVLRLRLPKFDSEEGKPVPMILREVEQQMLNELILKGLPEITKVSYTKEAVESKYKQYDEISGEQQQIDNNWIIETDGVALKKVMAVEKVDHTQTTSNDIVEILLTLGIEAARLSLINELRFVLNSYGIYVNYRHLGTLTDIMTNRGILTAITRHGINRVDSGALRKCSFEETVEILLEASFHSEVDYLTGVTENIIMGQLAPFGTGCFEVMMDCKELSEAEQITQEEDLRVDRYQNEDNQINAAGGTPQWMTPNVGGDSQYLGGATQYGQNSFTPMPMNSPTYSPAYQDSAYKQMSSPIYAPDQRSEIKSPIQNYQGGQSGYSPTTPIYGLQNQGVQMRYQQNSPQYGYNIGGGMSPNIFANQAPSMTPYSPCPAQYNIIRGGAERSPFNQNIGVNGTSLMSPTYNPTGALNAYQTQNQQSPLGAQSNYQQQYNRGNNQPGNQN